MEKTRLSGCLVAQIAAESGMSYAQNNLGGCTEMATELAQDYTLAFLWYKQAALQGHSDAQNNWQIFMKTEKALLKTRHSPHSGI